LYHTVQQAQTSRYYCITKHALLTSVVLDEVKRNTITKNYYFLLYLPFTTQLIKRKKEKINQEDGRNTPQTTKNETVTR